MAESGSGSIGATGGAGAALMARSLIFNAVFYVNLVIFLVLGSPVLLGPRIVAIRALQLWARSSLWLLRAITGTAVEWRGLENIPDGPLLVASKHQSLWETFALLTLFDDPAMVLKRELLWIPLHGWYTLKFRMIPVRREAGPAALRQMVAVARDRIAAGRQIIIFPEGTRRPVDAAPDYKPGVAALYSRLDVPCLPIALNSGLFWPRRSLVRRPGTIVAQVLEPIPPGLERGRFMRELEARIEPAAARLVEEARRQTPPLRLS